ncbi:MAG: argininosuccinate lyase [Spirochaetaceae bacterium]|nr:MAG: argininosuccinate lyase [Spirochaetaceae bacterium]
MAKIWQKNDSVHELIERFTVGRDYLLDEVLVPYDCAGSIAHARGLERIGVLTSDELERLESELRMIALKARREGFVIARELEDGHAAIEALLVERLADVGKKIHTGRSRNDQVLTASRLYARDRVLEILGEGCKVALAWMDFARKHALLPMPGRTHMQTAMPSTVGLWAQAWAEEILDDLELLWFSFGLIDRSPLGAAAGYGVPLPLDREFTAAQMGFAQVLENTIYVNSSRGKFEAVVLQALEQLMQTFSKLAQDLMLFSLPEFGYFSLPAQLCTGSSIMPQKKNPDGLELLRGRAGVMSGWVQQVMNVIRSLPSGYNRDFQDTKEPMIRGFELAAESVAVVGLTVEHLQVNEGALRAACTPELLATDMALKLVADGMSFRDAYREVGMNLGAAAEGSKALDIDEVIASRTAAGSPGNLAQESGRSRLLVLAGAVDEREAASRLAIEKLVPGFYA